MRKIITTLLFISLCFFHFTEAHAGEGDPKPNPHQLVVFFLHGFMGDATTFGSFPKILEEESGGKIIAKALTYDTKSLTKTTGDFYIQTAKDIVDFYRDPKNNIDASTPYSFVMHSQGGIVGLKYVLNCLKASDTNRCKSPEDGSPIIVPRGLKHFISIGTPYWGSSTALKQANSDFLSWIAKEIKLPLAQLEGLAPGSESLVDERNSLSVWDLPKEIEVYNIGGNIAANTESKSAEMISKLNSFLSSSKTPRAEFDLVVDIPSANMDYNYYIEKPKQSDGSLEVQSGRTQRVKRFFPILLPHVPTKHILGMADIEESADYSTHPSRLITTEIFNNFLNGVPSNPETLGKNAQLAPVSLFSLEIHFRLPRGYLRSIDMKEEQIKITGYTDEHRQPVSIDEPGFQLLRKTHGFNPKNIKENEKTEYQTYAYTTSVPKSYALVDPHADKIAPTLTAHVVIDVPGWQQKVVDLPINAGMNTFAELQMIPRSESLFPRTGADPAGKPDSRLLFNKTAGMTQAAEEYVVGAYQTNRGVKVFSVDQKNGNNFLKQSMRFQSSIDYINDLEKRNQITSAPDRLQNLLNRCGVATVGKILDNLSSNPNEEDSNHKGYLYSTYSDSKRKPIAYYRLKEGEKLVVLGRYSFTHSDTPGINQSFDRFLVTSPRLREKLPADELKSKNIDQIQEGNGLAWVNVVDVDITDIKYGSDEITSPCSLAVEDLIDF